MNIVVVGSGGREHALSWKLSQEADVVCVPGNPGIACDIETVPIPASETANLVSFAKDRAADLVVVGPEDPLIAGLADALREAGIPTYGPGAAAAQLEGSKAYSKDLMAAAGVPTAKFQSFSDYEPALAYVRSQYDQGVSLAVKASGAALGRGVVVAESREGAEAALKRMMIDREFGAAGSSVVLEERLLGREFSLLTIVGDHNFVSLPIAQDYKRAHDGDLGPNTGGMGSFSPCAWASPDLVTEVEHRMVAPILAALKASNAPFRGTLFTGVMVTPDGPRCLEYNVRFGDPEIQTVVMRLGKRFAQALRQSATGAEIDPPEVLPRAAVTVIVAGANYPASSPSGLPIEVGPLPPTAKLFFAGVAQTDGHLVTAGGRVLAATAHAPTLEQARTEAYKAAQAVIFPGARRRSDVAQ